MQGRGVSLLTFKMPHTMATRWHSLIYTHRLHVTPGICAGQKFFVLNLFAIPMIWMARPGRGDVLDKKLFH